MSQEFVDSNEYDEIMRRGLPKLGDVLFTTEAPLGEVANVDNENIALAQRVIKFRGKKNILNNYYLKYWIMSVGLQQFLSSLSTGSTAEGIKSSKLFMLPIVMPSKIDEQRNIVDYLDNKCNKIDKTIEKEKEVIEKLKEYKQSVITEAVTKGLNPDVKMKDSGVEWIGEIPEHWKILRGKNVLSLLKRPVEDNSEVITCFRDGQVTLRSNRREDGFTFSDKEIGYQGILKGDLVIHGMDGFAGAIGISDSNGKGSPVLNVCLPKDNGFIVYIQYYLRILASQNVFLALATGIRERSCDLRWNKIANLEFIVPPIKEQEDISIFLDKKCSAIDKLITNKEKIIEKLTEYKKSLIYECVTGKREIK